MIKEAEEKLEVTLPSSYINILREQNGGYIRFDSYPSKVQTTWADDRIPADYFLGIGKEGGILESQYLIDEWGLSQNIVIISGSGHSWIALDYRYKGEEPPIIYVDMENEQIFELAPDFDSFLKGLYIEESSIEDSYDPQEEREWTKKELNTALSSSDEQEIISAADYLCEHSKGNEQFIKERIIELLQSPNLEIKQLAANYAYHFKEMGTFSQNGIKEIISVLRRDDDLDYYVDMYFDEV